MSRSSARFSETRLFDNILSQTSSFYEPQLKAIGLSKVQIETQTLKELQDSLIRVNDAIQKPESFGTMGISVSGDSGIPYITKGTAEANIREVGILPLLLERKKLILDRITLLKKTQGIENLEDLVKQVTDEETKTKLKKEIDILKEDKKIREQLEEVDLAKKKEQARVFEDIDKLSKETEIFERRSKIWHSFLERESIATIVGSILLIIIAIAQIAAMFMKIPTTEVLNNAFLLILGYFFGQTIHKIASQSDKKEAGA